MTSKPTVFVASATEATLVDREVRATLESLSVEVLPWRETVQSGDWTLDALLDTATKVDGALLLMTTDDETWYRGKSRGQPRDNLLFELGLFMAFLGTRRAGVVRVTGSDGRSPELPSDLLGLNYISYTTGKTAQNELRLAKWTESLKREGSILEHELRRHLGVLTSTLRGLPEYWERDILNYALEPIKSAATGEVWLTPGQYYQRIYDEMERANEDWQILAIALMEPSAWFEERAQIRYIERNLSAVSRGARMRRLFVVPDEPPVELSRVIMDQVSAGIGIRWARRGQVFIPALHELEDLVAFFDTTSRLWRFYIAYSDPEDPTRVRAAKLVFDQDNCLRRLELFEQLWLTAQDLVEKSLDRWTLRRRLSFAVEAGVDNIERKELDAPVVSCSAAARAKGVPLANELKSLVLETTEGLVVCHVRGDQQISLRSVKECLGCEEARLAGPDRLADLGLIAGTVCPFLQQIWRLRHLLDERVLDLDYVTTNDGTLTGYLVFEPGRLRRPANVEVGLFAQTE